MNFHSPIISLVFVSLTRLPPFLFLFFHILLFSLFLSLSLFRAFIDISVCFSPIRSASCTFSLVLECPPSALFFISTIVVPPLSHSHQSSAITSTLSRLYRKRQWQGDIVPRTKHFDSLFIFPSVIQDPRISRGFVLYDRETFCRIWHHLTTVSLHRRINLSKIFQRLQDYFRVCSGSRIKILDLNRSLIWTLYHL